MSVSMLCPPENCATWFSNSTFLYMSRMISLFSHVECSNDVWAVKCRSGIIAANMARIHVSRDWKECLGASN